MTEPVQWQTLKEYQEILFQFYDGIAKIAINRPHKRNAFTPLTVQEMIDAMHLCREDPAIQVIILTGVGPDAFCSGGDQSVRGVGGYVGTDQVPRLNVLDLQKMIRSIPKAVIAMVAGYAIGGGHVLHVICDLTIAADNARFGQTGPKAGSFDGGFGASYLARIVGQKKAREIWFLCDQYDAQDALDMGLVNKVVPLAELEATTLEWCRKIMEKSPLAIRMLKASFNAELDGQAGIQELAGNATLLYYLSEEAQEGKKAFLEKEKTGFLEVSEVSVKMTLTATHHPYMLYFKQPAGTSRGVLTMRQVIFLRLAQADAPYVAGWGECGTLPGLSIDDRPDFATRVAQVCAAINGGQAPEMLDLAAWPALAFGLEMARRDLQNGGNFILYPTPFCQGKATLPTHGLIWMDSVAGLLAQIERKVQQGYRFIKMKVGALPLAQEVALLAEVRQRYPAQQISLRLDANGVFAVDEALSILDQLARFDIEFLEQPIRAGQWTALTEICAQSPIPIALDEELIGLPTAAQRTDLLTRVRPQYVVIKPTLLGGFQAAEEWIGLAEELGIGWWINSLLESNVGLNALCQWTSVLDPVRVHGLGTGQLFTNNIPSPLYLHGAGLRYDAAQGWDLNIVQYPYQ